jgi:hypothetical protein
MKTKNKNICKILFSILVIVIFNVALSYFELPLVELNKHFKVYN